MTSKIGVSLALGMRKLHKPPTILHKPIILHVLFLEKSLTISVITKFALDDMSRTHSRSIIKLVLSDLCELINPLGTVVECGSVVHKIHHEARKAVAAESE